MARDPGWLFAYWEVVEASRQAAARELADPSGRLVLRIYQLSRVAFSMKAVQRQQDIVVTQSAIGNWYVNIWSEGAHYAAELGLLSRDGRFVAIVRSNVVSGTRGSLSDRVDEKWVTVDRDYEKIFRLSGGDRVGGSSADIKRLLALKLESELSSGAVSSFSSGAFPARVSGGGAAAAKSFWLQVGTDLVVYGATEPGAEVRVQGKPIALREDGTFSVRFALPEGRQEIKVTAASPARDDSRAVTPVVERSTIG
jgi:hypothetical protein